MDKTGHPITIEYVERADLSVERSVLDSVFDAGLTGIVVRDALPPDLVEKAATRLQSEGLKHAWTSPNKGMPGGEIRTICDAATPTFTALRGPTLDAYARSANDHSRWSHRIFGQAEPTTQIASVFSDLFGGRPAARPSLGNGHHWAPFNFRALDPGIQIYSHHDNHYGLDIYQALDSDYDRSTLLSWFVTLQPAQTDGDLVIYGLWGSDPDPPMLPTRFLDTAALERDYCREAVSLGAGDMVIFDSGRHVHRVTPVLGDRPRLTLGGFLTSDKARSKLAFWC
ncbi:MAG: hypothetical protein CMH52_13720 [Myxococcales bacterium]|nr:hypothetical protein [Myxococcales bacterium]